MSSHPRWTLEVIDDGPHLSVGELRLVEGQEDPAPRRGEGPTAAFEHRDVRLHEVVDFPFDRPLLVSGRDPQESPGERRDLIRFPILESVHVYSDTRGMIVARQSLFGEPVDRLSRSRGRGRPQRPQYPASAVVGAKRGGFSDPPRHCKRLLQKQGPALVGFWACDAYEGCTMDGTSVGERIEPKRTERDGTGDGNGDGVDR